MANTVTPNNASSTGATVVTNEVAGQTAVKPREQMTKEEAEAFDQYIASTGNNNGQAPTGAASTTTTGAAPPPPATAQQTATPATPATQEPAATAQTAAPATTTTPSAPRMTDEAINNELNTFLPANKKDVKAKQAALEKQMNDPATPPELKAALQQLHGALYSKELPTLTDKQLEAVATFQRHRGALKVFKRGDLDRMINDPKTPPDLKSALTLLKNDPALSLMLDHTNGKSRWDHADSKFGNKDIDRLSRNPQIVAYNEKKAAGYVEYYIPSDKPPAKDPAAAVQPRRMTENDALQEMYLYSDSLPKNLGRAELEAIVQGTHGGKKMPPQVIAAAKFMLDHPDSWAKMTQDDNGNPSSDGRVKRSSFLDNVNRHVYLKPEQNETINTLDKHRDVFLNKATTRESLTAMANGETPLPADMAPEEVAAIRKAAGQLLNDPQLFGMLDNAANGHHFNKTKRTADDGKIGIKDLDVFLAKSKTRGMQQPDLPPATKPTTPEQIKAAEDMQAGALDDPDMKKKKGGDVIDGLKKIGGKLMEIAAGALHVVAIGLSFLGAIPILKPFAAVLSIAAEAAAGAIDVVKAIVVDGKDKAIALAKMGMGIAGAALGALVPGAGAVVAKGAQAGITKGVAMAATASVDNVASTAVGIATNTATDVAVNAGVNAGTRAADDVAVKVAAVTSSKTSTKAGTEGAEAAVTQTAKKETKDEAGDAAKNLAKKDDKDAKDKKDKDEKDKKDKKDKEKESKLDKLLRMLGGPSVNFNELVNAEKRQLDRFAVLDAQRAGPAATQRGNGGEQMNPQAAGPVAESSQSTATPSASSQTV